MATRFAAGVVAGTVLLLLPLACSDGGDDTGRSVDAEELRTEFTAASGRYRERVGEVQAAGRAALGQGEDAVLAVYRELRDAADITDRDLARLEVPAELQPRIDTLRDNLSRQVTVLDDLLAAAEAQDDAGVTAGLEDFATLLVDFATAQHAVDQELARGP